MCLFLWKSLSDYASTWWWLRCWTWKMKDPRKKKLFQLLWNRKKESFYLRPRYKLLRVPFFTWFEISCAWVEPDLQNEWWLLLFSTICEKISINRLRFIWSIFLSCKIRAVSQSFASHERYPWTFTQLFFRFLFAFWGHTVDVKNHSVEILKLLLM